MKYYSSLTLVLAALCAVPQYAYSVGNPIAEVVKLRGEITQLSPGAKMARKVVLGDKLVEDTSIVTGANSFIKIKLVDNSELNIGPESKIVITEMKKDEVGVISLLKGRIRTEVQKNVEDPTSNKFFIKTRTAALGVRGTDFQTIYNPDNKMTSLLTYKGEVAMAKIDEKVSYPMEDSSIKEVVRDEVTKEPKIVAKPGKKLNDGEALNKMLKKKDAVLVPSGQSSFSAESLKKTSLPVKISPVQLEALYKNEDFQEKTAGHFNLQKDTHSPLVSTLATAKQVAPAEGFYNEKTGDFAPKSGGFIDLKTGLYIAPDNESVLDAKMGVYVPKKIGNVDTDTGEYVAPKGLALDAKKGFVLAPEVNQTEENAPVLLALKENLNKNMGKEVAENIPLEEVEPVFNINEKFIRDRILLSFWSTNQELKVNENAHSEPYLGLSSKKSNRFAFEWQMASENRLRPLLGIDYSEVDYSNQSSGTISQESKKLMNLSFGLQYAWTQKIDLYTKIGLYQDHYLDQTANGTNNTSPGNNGYYGNTYSLEKVVLTRVSLGANSELWVKNKFSVDANAGGFLTFRKRINNFIIHTGTGLQVEVLPKYALANNRWVGVGLKIENQSQRSVGTVGINRVQRNNNGLELKYISDF